MSSLLPVNEASRLKTLLGYEILDTAAEQVFDDLALLATTICATPMAVIGFIDADRQWFKSRVGVPVSEIEREVSFCAHAILQNDLLIVKDTLADERFATNPLVTSEPAIRFYAGAPLIAPAGHALGAICVMDRRPHELQPEQADALLALSRQVIDHLELRRQAANLSQALAEQEAAVRTVRQRESSYRILLEEAPDGIHTYDLHGNIIEVNAKFSEMLGYTRDELLRLNVRDLVPEEDLIASPIRFAELAAGKALLTERRLRRKDGTLIEVEINGKKMATGRLQSIVRDITKRKRVNEALGESEEPFRQLAENIRGVFWLNHVGRQDLIYLSPAYEEIWGHTCESLHAAPRSWLDAVHPEERERIREAVETKQPRGDYDEEYRIIRPDGSLRWIQDRAFPIKNSAGEVYRIAGVATDITKLKLTERRLTAQYAVTRVLAEAVTMAEAAPQLLQVICKSLDWSLGALWFVNRAEDVLYCVEIWHEPSTVAAEFAAVSRQARYRRNTGFPSHVWAGDSPLWVADISADARFPRAPIAAKEGLHSAFGFPIRLGSEILGVMEFFSHDIKPFDQDQLDIMSTVGSQIGQYTVRKRAEEELQKTNAELEGRVLMRTAELAAANRVLEADVVERTRAEEAHKQLLHRLVGAHEEERRRIARELHDKMSQSLTMLIWGINSLKDSAQDQSATRTRLDRLSEITVEIAQEVQHLAWELRPAALAELGLQSALANYLAQWSERTEIVVDFHCANLDQPRLPPEIETTIFRIVQEALTNVMKHAQARRVSVIVESNANDVQVIVEDDGKGFEAERSLGGSNHEGRLGLIGMQERVAMVDGTWVIESSLGQGTTVFVRIPIPTTALRAAAHE